MGYGKNSDLLFGSAKKATFNSYIMNPEKKLEISLHVYISMIITDLNYSLKAISNNCLL